MKENNIKSPNAQNSQPGAGSSDQVSDQRVFQVTLHCVSEAIVAFKLRAESAEAAAQLAEEIAEKNIPLLSFPLGEADRYEDSMSGVAVCAVRPSAPGASYNPDDLHKAELMRSKIFPEEPIHFGRPAAPPSEDCLNN